MSGEGFENHIADEDISDTLGISTERNRFKYLVDFDGFGNTEFFTSLNHTKNILIFH